MADTAKKDISNLALFTSYLVDLVQNKKAAL
jgi:hypothetical protein